MNAPLVELTWEEIRREADKGQRVPVVRDGRLIGYARSISDRPYDPERAAVAIQALFELRQTIAARGHSATPEEIRAGREEGRE